MIIRYKFDPGMDEATQERAKRVLAKAFDAGEIAPCRCQTVEAWVYETRPPDFQASISCSCEAMRPLFSTTPETE